MTCQKDNINSVGLIKKSLNCIKNDLKIQNAHHFLSQDEESDGHFSPCQQMAQAAWELRLCHCMLPAWPAQRRLIPAGLRNTELAFRKPPLEGSKSNCRNCSMTQECWTGLLCVLRTKLLSHLGEFGKIRTLWAQWNIIFASCSVVAGVPEYF